MSFLLYWASTERDEVDSAWTVMIAVLVWIAMAMRVRGRARRIVQVVGVALIAWGAAYSVATSFTGYDDTLKTNSPGTYHALAEPRWSVADDGGDGCWQTADGGYLQRRH